MDQRYVSFNKNHREGYVYNSYGSGLYLKHVVSSVLTLRRYDRERPVAIYCCREHKELIEKFKLTPLFSQIHILPKENRSIPGFKHNLERFMPFNRNLFLDSDIVWCRDPDPLWTKLSTFEYTITGTQIADIFFGGHKGVAVLSDVLFQRRKKTLQKFGLSYLSRVQAGMIYASDKQLTKRVSDAAKEYFGQKEQTHFVSRKTEKGREDESCEWSLAMAMSALNLQVFNWLNGFESPQLDYISDYTSHDKDFKKVSCLYYSNRFVYDLKGIRKPLIRKVLVKLLSLLPGKGDHFYVTPYCLHFGWLKEKKVLNRFSEKSWNKVTAS